MSADSSTNTAPVPGELVFRRDQKARKQDGTYYCKHLVVAVHGMGDQVRNDFVQNIAELFARNYQHEAGDKAKTQACRLPMAYWDGGREPSEDCAIGYIPRSLDGWLNEYAFAEVYWADIPREIDVKGYRLEESTKWAGSVVERLCQRHDVARDFVGGPQLGATVLEEIAGSLQIIERLLSLAQAAGFMKLNLPAILSAYLGDVQQVADNRFQREAILLRFFSRMRDLVKPENLAPDADIHIIAHSEGTVVAFLGLLYALREETADEDVYKGLDFEWVKRVRSFSTLGSPIDKHLILWPEMWYRLSKPTTWRALDKRIRWRNYYDLADPVGFELDTARLQLEAWQCGAFEFTKDDDHGFRRYPLPGAAHVDYFGDVELFSHVIADAVKGGGGSHKPATTMKGRLSVPLPFVIVGAVHFAAVFALQRALEGKPQAGHPSHSIWGVLGCGALLYGTTILARVLRITRLPGPLFWALCAYVAGVAAYLRCPGGHSVNMIKNASSLFGVSPDDTSAKAGIVILSLALIAFAWIVDVWSLKERKPPIWGLRWLMMLGGGGVTASLVFPLLANPDDNHSALILLGSAAAFVYLWWLGALLFDLSFVWKTYINTQETIFKALGRELKSPDKNRLAPGQLQAGGQHLKAPAKNSAEPKKSG